MKIILGHMDKRLNSTKNVIPYDGPSLEVRLKDPCSISKPVFLLHLKKEDDVLFPWNNYIFYAPWGYYYIDDVIYVTNDLVEIYCHRDVLASGRDYIKATRALVKYLNVEETEEETAAKAIDFTPDMTLDDERLSPDKVLDVKESNIEKLLCKDRFVYDPNDGTVILSVVGKDAGIITYALTVEQFEEITRQVASGDVSTVDLLASNFYGENWRACVQSAVYVPIHASDLDWELSPSMLWGGIEISQSVPATGAPMSLGSRTTTVTLEYPLLFEDEIRAEDTLLKGERFAQVAFEYPGGVVDLSSNLWKYSKELEVRETFNIFTGDYCAKFFLKNVQIGQCNCSMGVDVMHYMSTMGSSFEQFLNGEIGLFKNSVGLVGSAVEMGVNPLQGVGDTVKSITGIVGDLMTVQTGEIQKYGAAQGGLECFFFNSKGKDEEVVWSSAESFKLKVTCRVPAMYEDFHEHTWRFHRLFGYPYNNVLDFKEITWTDGSYVQCIGASVGVPPEKDIHYTLSPAEIGELNAFLNSGIYIEEFYR